MTYRIVVTGPECTGKTTLARELAQALHTTWEPEYAREYAESHHRALTRDDVEAIARGQIEREDSAFTRSPNATVLVFDTDLVSTTVYAEHYYGTCPDWIVQQARQRVADLYLLSAIDLPWHADGVRDQPSARAAVHTRFAQRLRELGALVLPVSGLAGQRLQIALAAVRGWRASTAK